MNNNFILKEDVDYSMNLRDFNWYLESNKVTLNWEWPAERSIRLALVFQCEDENPRVEDLIYSNAPHVVIVRDLASHFTTAVPDGRCKFLVCPAYFDENKNIAVCTLSFITDWVYKKTEVYANVLYNHIPLSQYKKATLSISPYDLEPSAISYEIRERGYTVAVYTLDSSIISGGGHIYIKKSQLIKYRIHPDFAHLIDIK